ncbi:MAG TPA: DNA polymerase III subunit beta [Piscirickettsiaceae bacterium]|nr:DNA polymerase III subunit beta [Piscirickettsiaceae bacterium]HIQ40119.1 DNA polymerase III subunit beta [Sulfurivirga caldicuralii]
MDAQPESNVSSATLTLSRETLLRALQNTAGVVEKRQTKPILGNVLLQLEEHSLTVIATDLEIEVRAQVLVDSADVTHFAITVPALKLLNIVRALPDGVMITLTFAESGRCTLSAGRARFKLSTLPAEAFPLIDLSQATLSLSLPEGRLRQLIQHSHFAMAAQDVRYYLNGMCLDIQDHSLRVVATDGHRLSTCATTLETDGLTPTQAIVPRKGVLELVKLLSDSDDLAQLSLASNMLTVQREGVALTCKLIDGRYPDYKRVLPRDNNRLLKADRQQLKAILQRATILSNDRFRSVRLEIQPGLLTVHAQNAEQDEAHEELVVEYEGEPFEIAFNVQYLLDVIGTADDDFITLAFREATDPLLVTEQSETMQCQHVIMPMRL